MSGMNCHETERELIALVRRESGPYRNVDALLQRGADHFVSPDAGRVRPNRGIREIMREDVRATR